MPRVEPAPRVITLTPPEAFAAMIEAHRRGKTLVAWGLSLTLLDWLKTGNCWPHPWQKWLPTIVEVERMTNPNGEGVNRP